MVHKAKTTLRDSLACVRSPVAVYAGKIRQQYLRRIERGERHVPRRGGMFATRGCLQRRLREWLRGLLHR